MGILVGVNTETPNRVIGVLDYVVRAQLFGVYFFVRSTFAH